MAGYICQQHGIGSIVWRVHTDSIEVDAVPPGGIFGGGGGGGIFGRERPVRHLSVFHSLPLWGVNLHAYIITDNVIITVVSVIISDHQ